VLALGPGLPGAASEIDALARLYPSARRLVGAKATAAATAKAMDGAAQAHIACHGSFRADNPLFSALRLADGPLTLYDLEALDRAPRLVVLSACDVGLSGVLPGDELRGLATALLGLGTNTIVASVTPVPDEVVGALMVAFHEQLKAGRSPAEALASAERDLDAEPGAGGGFVCLGAG
jgi:CHAT domain-containing protein